MGTKQNGKKMMIRIDFDLALAAGFNVKRLMDALKVNWTFEMHDFLSLSTSS